MAALTFRISPMALQEILSANQYFLTDYASCRKVFLEHLLTVDAVSIERDWTVRGDSSAAPLTCDAVYIGNPHARQVIVVISGTHGIEGYCGSAIQRMLLQQISNLTFGLPDNLGLVLVHALNPWGMHWARRCDQDGIDLNRNFIDFARLPKPHPDYDKVLDCLGIKDSSDRQTALNQLRDNWGQKHFDEVYSGGQYSQPWAPFYGGKKPAFSNVLVDELINDWNLAERELVVIDLHTGLGPWGYGELISDHPQGSKANDFARALFGPAVAVTASGDSFSVTKGGLLDYRWHQLMQEKGCFLTLEFGTYNTEALFRVVLDDHLYWRDNPPPDFDDGAYKAKRKAMIEHFCPNNLLWQQAVLFKAWQVFTTVINYYSNE